MLGLSCDFWVCWHTLVVRTSPPTRIVGFEQPTNLRNASQMTFDLWLGCQRALTLFATPFAMLQASFWNFHNQFERHLTKQNVPLMLRCNFSFLKGVSIHERWYCTKKSFRCLPMMGKACHCRHATCLGPQHSGYHPQGHAFPYTITFLSNEWGLLDRHLGKC
jgi:hypothetical protein